MALEVTLQQARAQLAPGEELWEKSAGPCVFKYPTTYFYVYAISTPHRHACLDTDWAYLSASRHLRDIPAGWCPHSASDGMIDQLVWVVVR